MSGISNDDLFSDWMWNTLGIKGARLGPSLSGGNANVTRLVTSDDGRYVMRHPPAATVSPKAAAGIRREYDLLLALHGAAPVPRPVCYCDDPAVIGVPFALSGFVEGVAISERLPPAYGTEARVVNRVGEELIDALAAVHTLPWEARLPTGFGRPEGFLRRQVERWIEVRARTAVRDLPLVFRIGAWLLDNLPAETGPVAVVHCDYHLDNCLFDPAEPRLNAIIDWEMATLGDPMVDLGLLLMFWQRDEATPLGFRFVQRVTNRADIVDVWHLAARWEARTGYSAARLDYYRVFAFWRLAAIVEGAYVLQKKGEIDTAYARGLEHDVPNLLAEAAALINQE